MGRVLDPLLCVFLADIQSVGIGTCTHVCVWYTELTCISNGVSKTDIVVGKVQCVCVCMCVCVDRWRGHSRCQAPLTTGVDIYPKVLPSVCFWRGHSLCRAPLTTGVDIYPRVLPSAYCVLLAGQLPLQGALNHWGRYLPRVLPSANCVLLEGPLPLQGALNHWGRYLPQGPTICILCASGGATPIAGPP